MSIRIKAIWATLAASSAFWLMPVANAQTALEGQNLSALSPENLKKPRPKPPFDMTGTWNLGFTRGNLYGSAPDKLTPSAQAILDKQKAYAAQGKSYHEDAGACWPIGMPDMMARFWPIEVIQLPTMVRITSMFNNSSRWIYTDGRSHPPEDEMVLTYNGHSIGHWEGSELIVDTVGMTDVHHWVRPGIPASTKFHIVEHYRLLDKGNTLELTLHMTDPVNWEGDWVHTIRYARGNRTDIEEHVCIYEEMNQLPSFKGNIRN